MEEPRIWLWYAKDSRLGNWTLLTRSQNTNLVMIMTLVFPDSLSNTSPRTAPLGDEVSIPNNNSIQQLPTTWNPLSPISQDTTLAFAVPRDQASDFLASIQELPNESSRRRRRASDAGVQEPSSWVMRAAKNGGQPTRGTMRLWATNFWTGFVDLIKVHCSDLLWLMLQLNLDRMRSRSISSSWFSGIYLCI